MNEVKAKPLKDVLERVTPNGAGGRSESPRAEQRAEMNPFSNHHSDFRALPASMALPMKPQASSLNGFLKLEGQFCWSA